MADTQVAITANDIAYKHQVGRVGELPVWEVMTTGGLYLNLLGKNGKFDIVGTGSHRAISRFITEKKTNNKVVWTELSKADYVPVELIDPRLMADFELTTDRMAAAWRAAHGE